jgi:ABC-2 type transport system ATP-binding protein
LQQALKSPRPDELLLGLDHVSELEAVLAQLRLAGLQVLDMEVRKPDLEDVFVSLVSKGGA